MDAQFKRAGWNWSAIQRVALCATALLITVGGGLSLWAGEPSKPVPAAQGIKLDQLQAVLRDSETFAKANKVAVFEDVQRVAEASSWKDRDALRGELTKTVVETPGVLEALGYPELKAAVPAWSSLNGSTEEAARWMSRWVIQSSAAKNLKITELIWLGQALAKSGLRDPLVRKAQGLIGDGVATALTKGAKLHKDTYKVYLVDLDQGSKLLNEQQRIRTREALISNNLSNDEVIGSLSSAEWSVFAKTLDRLEREAGSTSLLTASWVNHTQAWKEVDASTQSQFFVDLFRDLPSDSKQAAVSKAKSLLSEHLWAIGLDPSSKAATADQARWVKSIINLGGQMSSARREILAKAVFERITGKQQDMLALPHAQIADAGAALVAVQHNELAATLLTKYLQFDGTRLATFADVFYPLVWGIVTEEPVQQPQADLCKLAESVTGRPLVASPSISDLLIRIQYLRRVGKAEQAKSETLARYRQLLVETKNLRDVAATDLAALASCILACDPQKEGEFLTGYSRFGEALAANLAKLAALEQTDSPWNYYMLLATPLGEPGPQQAIEAKLHSAEPMERFTALKLWGTIRKMRGELAGWRKELDQQLTNSSLGGDQRAEWLLGRSFAEELEYWDRAPLSGREFIDEAMASAESDRGRFMVTNYLVSRLVFSGQFEEATSVLDSMSFSDNVDRQGVDGLRRWIESSRQAFSIRVAQEARQRDRRRLEGQLDLLQTQLVISQEKHHSLEARQSLQKQIDQTREALSSLR